MHKPIRYTLAALFTIASAQAVYAQTVVSELPPYTDAQAIAAAQGLTSFSSPNIQMPNGAYIAHTIYQSRPSGSNINISGTTAQTVFSAIGDGSLTIQPAAMFVGARFHFVAAGRGQTGLANLSTFTGCLKLGTVSLVCGTTLAFPASTSAIPFNADVVCTVRSVGVSGTMTCKGSLTYAVGLSSGAALSTDLTTTSAVTIDTTAARTWDATGQLSSAIGAPSMMIYDAYIIQEN